MLWGEIDQNTLSRMLDKLYYDTSFRQSQSDKALAIANKSAYQWAVIADQWNNIFTKL